MMCFKGLFPFNTSKQIYEILPLPMPIYENDQKYL